MSIEAMNWAWSIRGLKTGPKFCLVALANYANDDFKAWPKIATLSAATDSSYRAVSSWLDKLEELGLIEREREQWKDGRLGGFTFWLKVDGPLHPSLVLVKRVRKTDESENVEQPHRPAESASLKKPDRQKTSKQTGKKRQNRLAESAGEEPPYEPSIEPSHQSECRSDHSGVVKEAFEGEESQTYSQADLDEARDVLWSNWDESSRIISREDLSKRLAAACRTSGRAPMHIADAGKRYVDDHNSKDRNRPQKRELQWLKTWIGNGIYESWLAPEPKVSPPEFPIADYQAAVQAWLKHGDESWPRKLGPMLFEPNYRGPWQLLVPCILTSNPGHRQAISALWDNLRRLKPDEADRLANQVRRFETIAAGGSWQTSWGTDPRVSDDPYPAGLYEKYGIPRPGVAKKFDAAAAEQVLA